MVGHRRSWPDTHDSFKGMWKHRHYTVNCLLYKKKKEQRCMHAWIRVHIPDAYMIEMCSVIYE